MQKNFHLCYTGMEIFVVLMCNIWVFCKKSGFYFVNDLQQGKQQTRDNQDKTTESRQWEHKVVLY